jgi:hypothetical protein
MGDLEDELARNTALRRRIEDYLTEHQGEDLLPAEVAPHFRPATSRYIRAIMTEMAKRGPLPRHGSDRSEVVTEPVVLLSMLIGWVINAEPEIQRLLTDCGYCQNHLLYLLDTLPYTDQPGARIGSRLQALPEVHRAHGKGGDDLAVPKIRWIMP